MAGTQFICLVAQQSVDSVGPQLLPGFFLLWCGGQCCGATGNSTYFGADFALWRAANQFFIDCFLLTMQTPLFSYKCCEQLPGEDVSRDFQVRRHYAQLDQAQLSARVPTRPAKSHWRQVRSKGWWSRGHCSSHLTQPRLREAGAIFSVVYLFFQPLCPMLYRISMVFGPFSWWGIVNLGPGEGEWAKPSINPLSVG